MSTITFYEVRLDWSQSRLPDSATEHVRQLFDAIQNAGAIDVKLLDKRSYGGQLVLNQSLEYLQKLGAIEKRYVQVVD